LSSFLDFQGKKSNGEENWTEYNVVFLIAQFRKIQLNQFFEQIDNVKAVCGMLDLPFSQL